MAQVLGHGLRRRRGPALLRSHHIQRARRIFSVIRMPSHCADALVICVPTPFTKWKAPDLSYIEAACKALAPYVGAGSLVVLQSTTYPGTTEELVRPLLEAPGRQAGRDFLLAFSPGEGLQPPVERPEVEHAAPLLSGQVWLQAG